MPVCNMPLCNPQSSAVTPTILERQTKTMTGAHVDDQKGLTTQGIADPQCFLHTIPGRSLPETANLLRQQGGPCTLQRCIVPCASTMSSMVLFFITL